MRKSWSWIWNASTPHSHAVAGKNVHIARQVLLYVCERLYRNVDLRACTNSPYTRLYLEWIGFIGYIVHTYAMHVYIKYGYFSFMCCVKHKRVHTHNNGHARIYVHTTFIIMITCNSRHSNRSVCLSIHILYVHNV